MKREKDLAEQLEALGRALGSDENLPYTVLRSIDEGAQPSPGNRLRLQGGSKLRQRYTRFLIAALLMLGMFLVVLLQREKEDTEWRADRPTFAALKDRDSADSEAPPTPSRSPVTPDDLAWAKTLYERGDVTGLLSLLGSDDEETRLVVARYLGELGDGRAIPVLQRLAGQWTETGTENPFTQAIDAIERQQSSIDGQQNAAHPDQTDGHATISGRIIDASTGLPIEGAQVSLDREMLTPLGPDGRFQLDAPTLRTTATLHVTAPGFATRRITVRLERGEDLTLSIELSAGSHLLGTVRDSGGHPVAQAAVRLSPYVGLAVQTDEAGSFSFDGLDPAVWTGLYTLQVKHPDFSWRSLSFTPPGAGQRLFQEVVLQRGVTLAGRVTDRSGNPIPNARVGAGYAAETDSQGRYRLLNVPVTNTVISATGPSLAPYVGQYDLSPGQREMNIDIRLTAGRSLRGRVVDEQGSAVVGISVAMSEYDGLRSLNLARVKTDTEGRFDIPHAPASGALILAAYGKGFAHQEHRVDFDSDEQAIVVRRAGRIYGRVFDDDTNQPISQFRVRMDYSQDGSHDYGYNATWSRQGYTLTSPQGYFDTAREGLPIGEPYEMTVYAEGYDPLRLDPIRVQPVSDDPNRTAFALRPATWVSGRVVDEQGLALEGAHVAIFAAERKFEREYWRTTHTDTDGLFMFKGTSVDEQYVYVSHEGFAPQFCTKGSLKVEVTDTRDIVLSLGSSLYGTVRGPDGAGLANAQVRVRAVERGRRTSMRNIFDRSVRTDLQGFYRIDDLPVGLWSADVRLQANRPIERQRIETLSGEAVQLDFGAVGGFALSGEVRVGPYPLQGAMVELAWGQGQSKAAYTDPLGAYRIVGLDAERYEMTVEWYPEDAAVPPHWKHSEQYICRRSITVEEDVAIDIDLGIGSISGTIPDRFLSYGDLSLDIRRYGPDSKRYGQLYSQWQTVHGVTKQLDADGRFLIQPLHVGTYSLVLRNGRQVFALADLVELEPSEHREGVVLHHGDGRLHIQVVDEASGTALPHARFGLHHERNVRLYDRTFVPSGDSRMATDERGEVLYQGLPSGGYRVIASAPGYLARQSDVVDVVDDDTHFVRMALAPAAAVRFELSAALKRQVGAERPRISCLIWDAETNAPLERLTVWGSEVNYRLNLPRGDEVDGASPVLDLPPGTYDMEYRLYDSNRAVYEGHTRLTTTLGQVTTLYLSYE